MAITPTIAIAKISKYSQSNPPKRITSTVKGEKSGNPLVAPGKICPFNQVSKATCDRIAENEIAAKR